MSYVIRQKTIVSSLPERPKGVITSLTSINSLFCKMLEKDNPQSLGAPDEPEDWGFSILVVGLHAYVSFSVSTAGATAFGIA